MLLSEVARVNTSLSDEFSAFHKAYYENVPWYAGPPLLLVLCIGAFGLCCVVYLLLPRESVAAR
jgi:hypothetical protein